MGSFQRHKRTIRIADFEAPRGAVTIEALMAMDRPDWEHLRDRINLRRADVPDQPLARCRQCEHGVFIRAQAVDDDHVPMFAHFPGGPEDCPWYDGGTMTPDDARAAQYQGHQESALHRRTCQTVEVMAKQDSRCAHSAIDTYLRPAIHKRGRYPDVFLDMTGLGRFAVEVQLSKPFAPEISARHLHYDREGVNLIWVFLELAKPLPQGFRDVISMQRGNAFLFDAPAEAESLARGTLVLSCYLEDGKGGWLVPRLVTLDDLDLTTGRSAFLEDRRSERLIALCKDGRSRWWQALQQARREKPDNPFRHDAYEPPWASVRAHVPALSSWKDEHWARHGERGRDHLASLFAILCSVAHSAERGEEVLYISRYSGEGRLLAMLNSKLSSATFFPYADLIETFIGNTVRRDLAERESFRKLATAARAGSSQIDREHPIWRVMERLFPEALDPLIRAELADLGRLPGWAGEAVSREAEAA